jgi:hypothetical protein
MRNELLALTPDALAALTNRGLVKRAAREVDAALPPVEVDPDGTVRCVLSDGAAPTLPPGGLDGGACTCGAVGVCRHLVGLVLAYQRQIADAPGGAADAPGVAPRPAGPPDVGAPGTGTGGGTSGGGASGGGPQLPAGPGVPSAPASAVPPAAPTGRPAPDTGSVVDWSPGTFTDAALEARLGPRLLAVAHRARRVGYLARVHRPSAVDAAPRVELGSATVRFLVPHDLGFVHTDAVTGTRDDVVALAVWAFRVADERAPTSAEVQVEVGGDTSSVDGRSGIEPALALADVVLRDGAVHSGHGLAATAADVRRRLDTANLRWPLLAIGDLEAQLRAYHDRSSRYRPDTTADLLAELHARHRAVVNGGAGLRSRVLGTEEAAETPLRRVRLDGLGCRVRTVEQERVVEVYFAHGDTATVLVLRKAWTGDDTGPVLARRRIAGSTVAALAAGNLVTESAVRTASRAVRLAGSRLSTSTATPSRGAWEHLPDRLVVRDLRVLADELDAAPPRVVRPRVEAELVRVLGVAEVRSVTYSPGQQRLDAVFADPAGTIATITATHTREAPGALDATARALAGDHGPVRFVSGVVHRSGGGILVEPFAFAVDDALVVPDLAAPDADAALGTAVTHHPDPFAGALGTARDLLAEVPHRGLVHLPATYGGRLRTAAATLTAMGLRRVGDGLTGFAATLGPDPGETAIQAWVDAYLRVIVALDMV